MFDTNEGRFLQRDPLGFAAGSVNLYEYAGSNSVNALDPRAYASPLLQDTVATEDFFEEIGVQSRCEALLGDTQLGRVRLQQ